MHICHGLHTAAPPHLAHVVCRAAAGSTGTTAAAPPRPPPRPSIEETKARALIRGNLHFAAHLKIWAPDHQVLKDTLIARRRYPRGDPRPCGGPNPPLANLREKMARNVIKALLLALCMHLAYDGRASYFLVGSLQGTIHLSGAGVLLYECPQATLTWMHVKDYQRLRRDLVKLQC
eukprot:3519798-Pleurochrysis_carterae.AAC.3